jgi:hypothetical protein
MELENIITKIVNDKLNNPIFELFKEIKIKTILKKSNFIKKKWYSPIFCRSALYLYDNYG